MELAQRGLLDTELEFGRADLLLQTVENIAFRRNLGDELAHGSKRLAEKYKAPETAMQVKGLEFPAYDPRGMQGQGLLYATSNRGACHLRGNMLFGVSRAISRKNSAVEGCKALIVDLREVVHLGVSSALVLEETILDMIRAGRCVYLVGALGQPRNRLEKLGVLQQLPAENIVDKRITALEKAIYSCLSDSTNDNSAAAK
jgi:aldehyde:ferredoxin oxidoreductase